MVTKLLGLTKEFELGNVKLRWWLAIQLEHIIPIMGLSKSFQARPGGKRAKCILIITLGLWTVCVFCALSLRHAWCQNQCGRRSCTKRDLWAFHARRCSMWVNRCQQSGAACDLHMLPISRCWGKHSGFALFLSRLNVVQKETMWSLILYVVCVCSMCMYVCGNFCKIDHCIRIHWCIPMGLGHNDPWVESHMWPQQMWGQRSSRD